MFKSIKRLLITATLILAVSAPSAAYAMVQAAPGGSSTSGQAQPSIISSAPRATVSSSQGFQWGDAGIGAAGVLGLVGVGSGAALVIRRRVRQPVAS
jgi:hypothetical protein